MLTRQWTLTLQWKPLSFRWRPYFSLRRTWQTRGFALSFYWLGLLTNLETWNYTLPPPAKPRPACTKTPACPYPRDGGECLRRQGVPGAGGSFGDWCDCNCHRSD